MGVPFCSLIRPGTHDQYGFEIVSAGKYKMEHYATSSTGGSFKMEIYTLWKYFAKQICDWVSLTSVAKY